VTLGVLYSNSPAGVLRGEVGTDLMAVLPMSLIPSFGVPITLVAHLLSLINLAGRRAVGRERRTPPATSTEPIRPATV
jgi:hypothetical protein